MKKIETLSDGTLPHSSWPGMYPLVYIMEDGGVLCASCANGKNGSLAKQGHEDPQWNIVGQQIQWENECGDDCDHCGKRLEAAYQEDVPSDKQPLYQAAKDYFSI